MKKMSYKEAINEVEKLIENTDFTLDYDECDVKDGFVYVTVKIKLTEE